MKSFPCQICHKNQAVVHIIDDIPGEKNEIHICRECAEREGHISKSVSLQDAMTNFLGAMGFIPGKEEEEEGESRSEELGCEQCGTTISDFLESGKFGCPNDYEVFSEILPSLFSKMHGACKHVGKEPGFECRKKETKKTVSQKVKQLMGELEEAIKIEDYEKAAVLRDELKKLIGESE